MGRRKTEQEGFGKLLDAWSPPQNAGDPVGCLATTFTFSAAFFEEECLARFLNLESEPNEDGAVHLIEREEKLAQVKCAAVLVDGRHCRGARSLRWDILPVRVGTNCMHAKISLLHWSNRIRLIIASANLTEDGYRRNQEIFGVLDYYYDTDAPLDCLMAFTDLLRRAAQTGRPADAPELLRSLALIEGAEDHARSWVEASIAKRQVGIRIHPVVVEPGGASAFVQIRELWPEAGPPREAVVVSPFFDTSDKIGAAHQIWSLLNQRGEAHATYRVVCEESPADGPLVIRAPRTLLDAAPKRPGVTASVERITLEANRPLHAKTIWLDGNRWSGFMIGSSNFTSNGLGLAKSCNYEANLLYLVDAEREPKKRGSLLNCVLPGEDIDAQGDVRWEEPPEDESEITATDVLSAGFGNAILKVDKAGQLAIRLEFQADSVESLPNDWRVLIEESDEVWLDEAQWDSQGRPQQVEKQWLEHRPPSVLRVTWKDASQGERCAWWPVIAESSNVLPPPDELRNLPLEILIEILTSARPLHRLMERYLRQRMRSGNNGEHNEIDPHRKVDTSRFLLQRTRHVSWALAGLRARLERPVATPESLAWRLHGPVGVRALQRALVREAHSPEEALFLLAELVLELRRVRPSEGSGVPVRTIRSEIELIVDEVCRDMDLEPIPSTDPLRRYASMVLEGGNR